MDDFNTIRLKRKTIEKFKMYSKRISPSYSETLDYMMAFFRDNKLSPYDTLHVPPLQSMTYDLRNRTEALISILRNMEKTQLIPTRKMLERLFEYADEEEEEEAYDFGTPKLMTNKEIEDYYRKEYEKMKELHYQLRKHVHELLSKLTPVHKHFGKDYYRLDTTEEDIKNLRSKLH